MPPAIKLLFVASAPDKPLLSRFNVSLAAHAGDHVVVGVAAMNVPADKTVGLPLRSRCLMLVDPAGRFPAATIAVMKKNLFGLGVSDAISRAVVFLQKVAPILAIENRRAVLGAKAMSQSIDEVNLVSFKYARLMIAGSDKAKDCGIRRKPLKSGCADQIKIIRSPMLGSERLRVRTRIKSALHHIK